MTQKRMDDMEIQIKALNDRVDKVMTRMNILMIIGLLSPIASLLIKFFLVIPTPAATPPNNTNSVQIGGTEQPKPQREYLDSDEVGEREGVTSRTVINWIEQGRISPQPTRQGRAWIISANYRILPQAAETAQK